jgi:hypothetical protein
LLLLLVQGVDVVTHGHGRMEVLRVDGWQLHTNHSPEHSGATACNTQFGVSSLLSSLHLIDYKQNLKASDDGVLHSEPLCLWTLSIVRNSKYYKNTTFRKLDLLPSSSEKRATSIQLGRLERTNLNH